MHPSIKSLGWFNRFVRPHWRDTLTRFHVEVLGLPFLREGSQQPVDFLWAGEALIHELIYEGLCEATEPDGDPARARMVPIYRVGGIDTLVDRLRGAGADVLPVAAGPLGRETFIREPSGCLIGLREAPAGSTREPDRVARARARRGEAFNPGCTSMPEGWQELGWIRRRVVDVDAMARFYSDVVGLSLIERVGEVALLDLGDNGVLELAPGGRVDPLPANRAEMPATIILRVDAVSAYRDRVRDAGAPIVHDLIAWDRGVLTYFADPENNLVGVEEKYHPSRYAPAQLPFPEDLEAQRRWVDARAARENAA